MVLLSFHVTLIHYFPSSLSNLGSISKTTRLYILTLRLYLLFRFIINKVTSKVKLNVLWKKTWVLCYKPIFFPMYEDTSLVVAVPLLDTVLYPPCALLPKYLPSKPNPLFLQDCIVGLGSLEVRCKSLARYTYQALVIAKAQELWWCGKVMDINGGPGSALRHAGWMHISLSSHRSHVINSPYHSLHGGRPAISPARFRAYWRRYHVKLAWFWKLSSK